MVVTTYTELFSEQEWTLLTEDLNLSPRQAEIVNCVFRAKSDKQIARELDISVATVRTHMGRLFEKFDLNDRVELLVHVFMSLRSIGEREAIRAAS